MHTPSTHCPRTAVSQRANRNTRGFTLIELLVVIAIVGVLSSIGFYGIQTARIKTKQATCNSNLRACGQGFSLFLVENEGYFPGAGPDLNGRVYRWMHRIGNYMDLAGPRTDRNSHEFGMITTFDDAFRMPIFHSPFTDPALYSGNALPRESAGVYGANTNILTRNRHRGISAAAITSPSNTILLAERYSGISGSDPATGILLDMTGAYPEKNLGPAANTRVASSQTASGPSNFLFADFHVRTIDLETIDWSDINSATPSGRIRYQP